MTGNHCYQVSLSSLNQWQYQNTNLPGKSTAFRDVFFRLCCSIVGNKLPFDDLWCKVWHGCLSNPVLLRTWTTACEVLESTLRWFHGDPKQVDDYPSRFVDACFFAEDIASTYKCCLTTCTTTPGAVFWNSKGYAMQLDLIFCILRISLLGWPLYYGCLGYLGTLLNTEWPSSHPDG